MQLEGAIPITTKENILGKGACRKRAKTPSPVKTAKSPSPVKTIITLPAMPDATPKASKPKKIFKTQDGVEISKTTYYRRKGKTNTDPRKCSRCKQPTESAGHRYHRQFLYCESAMHYMYTFSEWLEIVNSTNQQPLIFQKKSSNNDN